MTASGASLRVDQPRLAPDGVAIGYARTSTRDQSPELQVQALAAANCFDVYVDEGISGKTMERPQLIACLRALQPGNTLIVWKLDRLGRDVRGLSDLIASLDARDVAFRSLTEGIDTTTHTGKLVFHVIAAVAEMERELIRERTRAGLAAAKGKSGRPPALKSNDRDLVRRLRRQGWTVGDIAADRNVSESTIRRALATSES